MAIISFMCVKGVRKENVLLELNVLLCTDGTEKTLRCLDMTYLYVPVVSLGNELFK